MDEFEVFDVKPFVSRLLGMGCRDSWTKSMKSFQWTSSPNFFKSCRKEALRCGSCKNSKFSEHIYLLNKRIRTRSCSCSVFSMLPGFSLELMPKGGDKESQAKIKRYMTMMDSMIDEELDRTNPKLMNESRMTRMARGSGRQVRELIEMFEECKRLMKSGWADSKCFCSF
ncbi:putative signal-recognition-particle GTPase [Helianthus annuus]|nr:putative signal-recognition-particle GTPase [Helianthus annuus]